jgi:hypothetical protein
VVTFWDVLEHTFSPAAELRRTADLLRAGGLVAINIPNWRSLDRRLFGSFWIGFDPPRHLYVFTPESLTALVEKSGFRPLRWLCFMPSYFAFSASVERWLQTVWPKGAAPLNRMLSLPGARFIFEPWFAVMNALGLGGVITLLAQKRG